MVGPYAWDAGPSTEKAQHKYHTDIPLPMEYHLDIKLVVTYHPDISPTVKYLAGINGLFLININILIKY